MSVRQRHAGLLVRAMDAASATTPTSSATDAPTRRCGSDAPQDSDSGAADAAAHPPTTPPLINISRGAADSVENYPVQDLTGDVKTEQGAAGSVVLGLTLSNHGQVCNPHTTASLVVYPPESYDVISVPYETQTYDNPKISQLDIKGFGG